MSKKFRNFLTFTGALASIAAAATYLYKSNYDPRDLLPSDSRKKLDDSFTRIKEMAKDLKVEVKDLLDGDDMTQEDLDEDFDEDFDDIFDESLDNETDTTQAADVDLQLNELKAPTPEEIKATALDEQLQKELTDSEEKIFTPLEQTAKQIKETAPTPITTEEFFDENDQN